jgi:hypothetical protein
LRPASDNVSSLGLSVLRATGVSRLPKSQFPGPGPGHSGRRGTGGHIGATLDATLTIPGVSAAEEGKTDTAQVLGLFFVERRIRGLWGGDSVISQGWTILFCRHCCQLRLFCPRSFFCVSSLFPAHRRWAEPRYILWSEPNVCRAAGPGAGLTAAHVLSARMVHPNVCPHSLA